MFNEKIEIDGLETRYTKKSIKNFVEYEWNNCYLKNKRNFDLFVKKSLYLKEKPIENNEDIIYFSNDLPMPNWKIYVIADYLRMIYEIELTRDERKYFEIALAYLFYYKKVPFENIKVAIKNLIPLKDKFMQKFKSAKSLKTKEAEETIEKMLIEYESEI